MDLLKDTSKKKTHFEGNDIFPTLNGKEWYFHTQEEKMIYWVIFLLHEWGHFHFLKWDWMIFPPKEKKIRHSCKKY